MWEALCIPTHLRLVFMRKYSTEAYSGALSKAVDHWSEVAVFAIGRLAVIDFAKKYKVIKTSLKIAMLQ